MPKGTRMVGFLWSDPNPYGLKEPEPDYDSWAPQKDDHPFLAAIKVMYGRSTPGVMTAYAQIAMHISDGHEVSLEAAELIIRKWIDDRRARDGLAALSCADSTHPPHGHVVYYMRMSGLCKIGTSICAKKRLREVGAEELLATEPGDRRLERVRHLQFSSLHNHLEWFRYEGELVEWVESLQVQQE